MRTRIAASIGDVAGIGPEILLRALLVPDVLERVDVTLVGSRRVLAEQAAILGLEAAIPLVDVHDVDGPQSWAFGEVSGACGAASLRYLEAAVGLVQRGEADALVTAPINKESWKAAGITYPGHTEALGALFGCEVETMFVARRLRIFFLTRHLSLANAIRAINAERLEHLLHHAHGVLTQYGIDAPTIAVAALNPHGGEHGLFGDEEERHLVPGIEAARRAGIDAVGPVPSDAVFHQALQGRFDAVISLFHDQGHIAAKVHDFYGTVSVTTGLPKVRASVDHGTAFDIAGKGVADAAGQVQAFLVAAELTAGALRG